MPNLFDKINLVIQSNVNQLLNGDTRKQLRKDANHAQLQSGDMDKQVKALHNKIEEALKHEDEIQAKIDGLYAEVAEWDAKADRAVKDDRDEDARFAVMRMQVVQQRITVAETDLLDHKAVTQELQYQVNTFESVLEEAKQSAAIVSDEVLEEDDRSEDSPSTPDIGQTFADVLNQTREALDELVDKGKELTGLGSDVEREVVSEESQSSPTMEVIDEVPQPPKRPEKPTTSRDNSMDARRSRLSKPDDQKKK